MMHAPATRDLIQLAWEALPAPDRRLLAQVGADRWEVVSQPLGQAVDGYLRSAGERPLPAGDRRTLDAALGIWVQSLKLVLINETHPELSDADKTTREALLIFAAWHEWGHALSVSSGASHDLQDDERLLDLAPDGIRERIRRGHYRRDELIHELTAETYALVMRELVEGNQVNPHGCETRSTN